MALGTKGNQVIDYVLVPKVPVVFVVDFKPPLTTIVVACLTLVVIHETSLGSLLSPLAAGYVLVVVHARVHSSSSSFLTR